MNNKKFHQDIICKLCILLVAKKRMNKDVSFIVDLIEHHTIMSGIVEANRFVKYE
jgi:hypothetical protein